MPYEMEASREHPGCFIFLLDRSHSMTDPWGTTEGADDDPKSRAEAVGGNTDDTPKSKAEGVAEAMNEILRTILFRCKPHFRPEVFHYYDIAVVGYGEEVDTVLPGTSKERPFATAPELWARQRTVEVDGISRPVWFEPYGNNGTPMALALDIAGRLATGWASVESHRSSFPPIVINISDGIPTDSENGDPREWAERLRAVETNDGALLLFNVNLSSDTSPAIRYPHSPRGLPDKHARLLYDMSSPLPDFMRADLARQDPPVVTGAGARGFVFNASLRDLIQALEVGTKPRTRRDEVYR